jgi:transcription factor TFIIIB component B''
LKASNELPSSAKDSSVEEPSEEKKTTESRVIPSSLKPASRKRKQSTSVSVGFVRNAEDAKIQATAAQEESSSSEAPSAAIVVASPEPANQDRDILERLRAENPDGVRLSSFCTPFKGPKREHPQNQKAAAPPPQANIQQSPPKKKSTSESNGAPVVQIIDGEIVLQESSLQVPGQRRTVEEVEAEYHDVVEEDATLGIVGASINSFVTRKGPQHWSVDETKRFYEALQQLGPDFGCMEAFFENRTRKQLKRKYQAEMTRNSKLVEMALDPKYQTDIGKRIWLDISKRQRQYLYSHHSLLHSRPIRI